MKLCKDCKYCDGGLCRSPKNLAIDRSTGEKVVRWISFCSVHRSGGLASFILAVPFRICGPQGKWFEPKEKS